MSSVGKSQNNQTQQAQQPQVQQDQASESVQSQQQTEQQQRVGNAGAAGAAAAGNASQVAQNYQADSFQVDTEAAASQLNSKIKSGELSASELGIQAMSGEAGAYATGGKTIYSNADGTVGYGEKVSVTHDASTGISADQAAQNVADALGISPDAVNVKEAWNAEQFASAPMSVTEQATVTNDFTQPQQDPISQLFNDVLDIGPGSVGSPNGPDLAGDAVEHKVTRNPSSKLAHDIMFPQDR
jgi:hypothetical protein